MKVQHVQMAFFLLGLVLALPSVAAPPEGSTHGEPAAPPMAPQATIRLSPEQRQMIGVTYGTVERRPVSKTIRAVARVDFDERRLADVTFKIGGWVQDLFVNYTGKQVRKGEPLLTLYSPELVTGQQEYLLALQTQQRLAASKLPEAVMGSQGLVAAARRRLLLWDLTPQQINTLEKRGAAEMYISLQAPISGTIIEKAVVAGMKVEPGMKLYRLADLSTVWVYADIYEPDIPLVREGQPATIVLASYPGETFTGTITYVYPYLDTKTRTNKVRMEFTNSQGKLKPGMYANSEIAINLGSALTVPESVILQSGLKQLAFVDQGQGVHVPREVKTGIKVGDRFTILAGLTEGERVVTSGNFLLDSESKLQAATSMMGMMGAIGMGDWKMESARPMDMTGQVASAQLSEKKVGAWTVTIATTPAVAKMGDNTLRIQVQDNAGAPVTDATVNAEYTMDMPGMMIDKAQARHVGGGLYEAPVRFTMAGPWGVTIAIRRPGQAEARARFTVSVGQ